jgi:hypothetical protein
LKEKDENPMAVDKKTIDQLLGHHAQRKTRRLEGRTTTISPVP